MAAATYTVGELSEMLRISTFSIYEAIKRDDFPVPPIKVGHRIVFAKVAVDRLLQLEEGAS
jgi:predicted DNA-binding transcriptional regulator AlpA